MSLAGITLQPTDAMSVAWKAVRCGYLWHRSKTARARRKPVKGLNILQS